MDNSATPDAHTFNVGYDLTTLTIRMASTLLRRVHRLEGANFSLQPLDSNIAA